MRCFSIALVLCVFLLAPSAGAISGIGVFADALATDCDMSVQVVGPFTFYVVAWTSGDAAADCGVLGADLRVTGVPAAWFANAVPAPAGIASGNILGPGGHIEFTPCMLPGLSILLYTVNGFAPSVPPQGFSIRAAPRTDVANPCAPIRPTLTVCDQVPTRICAVTSDLLVNGPPCTTAKPAAAPLAGGTCLVAIEPQSWSAVKHLYLE